MSYNQNTQKSSFISLSNMRDISRSISFSMSFICLMLRSPSSLGRITWFLGTVLLERAGLLSTLLLFYSCDSKQASSSSPGMSKSLQSYNYIAVVGLVLVFVYLTFWQGPLTSTTVSLAFFFSTAVLMTAFLAAGLGSAGDSAVGEELRGFLWLRGLSLLLLFIGRKFEIMFIRPVQLERNHFDRQQIKYILYIQPILVLAMSSIEDLFKQALDYIKNLPADSNDQSIDNETKLKFYALFKQATAGPNKTKAPSRLKVVDRYKWEEWKKLGDMSKPDAMRTYVETLTKKSPTWNTKPKL